MAVAIQVRQASLVLGGRKLWQKLDLAVKPGEFVAVLGPNGSGKTSFIKVLLGLVPLAEGSVELLGESPRRGNSAIGYIPQLSGFDSDTPVRGRDLVRFGLDGHRYGFGMRGASRRVDEMIAKVGASAYANAPIGQLSGGEQQRLRIAQALMGDPQILLCDEPLLSLDLSQQQAVAALIDERRRQAGATVLFITHDINPILPLTDRVVYLVGERWAVGTPNEILTTETLSQLYGAPVDVLKVRGRIIVVGAGEALLTEPGHHHHEHDHGPRGAH
jgi:zinc/manganese transport system ATP-binding protein